MERIRLKKDYEQYPSYQSSGVEWIGNIPEGWDTRKFKFLGTTVSGGTPDTENLEYWDGDIPWVSPKDMKFTSIADTHDHITPAGLYDSASRIVPAESLLTVYRSGILKHSIPTAITSKPVAINQDIRALIPKPVVEPRYYQYLIEGNQRELLKIWSKNGATVESLESRYVEDSIVPLPSVEEQKRIVSYLDQKTELIDKIIAKKCKLIELLKERRTAIIHQTVSRGLYPKAELVDSGISWLGKIPKGWKVEPLKQGVKHIARGISPEYDEVESNTPVINQACIYWDNLRLENVKYQVDTVKPSKRGLLQPGDLLINSTGTGTLGRAVVFRKADKFFADGHVTIVRTRPKLKVEYLARLISTSVYQGYIYASAVSGSTNQIELSRERLRLIPTLLPPLAVQDEIIAVLERRSHAIDNAISRIEQSLEVLVEFKQSLISQVVTGKVQV